MADGEPLTLKQILGAAYGLHQLQRDRAAAIALVGEWLAGDDARRTAAEGEVKRIKALFAPSWRRGDHISAVYLDILSAALAS